MVCIAVPQYILEQVLRHGLPPEKFDAWALSCVDMISVDPKEGHQLVGLSYIFPRVYSLLELGWHQINAGGQGIFGN